jgi:hypothetical protein
MGGVKRVHRSTNGPKKSKTPRLGDWMQAAHVMDLSVILQAYWAARIIVVPNLLSRLSG